MDARARSLKHAELVDPQAAAAARIAEFLRRGGRDPRVDPRQGDEVDIGRALRVYGLGWGGGGEHNGGRIVTVYFRCGMLHSSISLDDWRREVASGVVTAIAATDLGDLIAVLDA